MTHKIIKMIASLSVRERNIWNYDNEITFRMYNNSSVHQLDEPYVKIVIITSNKNFLIISNADDMPVRS